LTVLKLTQAPAPGGPPHAKAALIHQEPLPLPQRREVHARREPCPASSCAVPARSVTTWTPSAGEARPGRGQEAITATTAEPILICLNLRPGAASAATRPAATPASSARLACQSAAVNQALSDLISPAEPGRPTAVPQRGLQRIRQQL